MWCWATLRFSAAAGQWQSYLARWTFASHWVSRAQAVQSCILPNREDAGLAGVVQHEVSDMCMCSYSMLLSLCVPACLVTEQVHTAHS